MLFVPGDRPERMERAINSGADAVVFDLEDSVTAGRHDDARTSVRAKLKPGGIDRWVRILPYGSADADRDLEAIVRPGLAGVILPEIRDAATVRAADARITQLESAAGVTAGSISLLPLIESALGLHRAFEILSASSRVTVGAFAGAPGGDLCTDLGAQPTPGGLEMLHARSHLVLEARAAGMDSVLDAVWVDLEDAEGLGEDSRLGRRLGFTGRFAIHPSQIAVLHDAYSPTDLEIADARAVVAAYQTGTAHGHGAIRHRGRLVDRAMALAAERLLASIRQEPVKQ
jgi:citrate lyase subunit beta/citryl-CoA lyase